jgi:hypothetical protein
MLGAWCLAPSIDPWNSEVSPKTPQYGKNNFCTRTAERTASPQQLFLTLLRLQPSLLLQLLCPHVPRARALRVREAVPLATAEAALASPVLVALLASLLVGHRLRGPRRPACQRLLVLAGPLSPASIVGFDFLKPGP